MWCMTSGPWAFHTMLWFGSSCFVKCYNQSALLSSGRCLGFLLWCGCPALKDGWCQSGVHNQASIQAWVVRTCVRPLSQTLERNHPPGIRHPPGIPCMVLRPWVRLCWPRLLSGMVLRHCVRLCWPRLIRHPPGLRPLSQTVERNHPHRKPFFI